MKVNRIIENTYAEGPGCRFCIWVQGCKHNCNGCFATELWDYNKGYECSKKEIIKKIKNVKEKIQGITFLGGEPLDKARELAYIAKKSRQLGKNIITFTGYTYQEIKESNNKDWNELLKYTDLLIDGKFEEKLLDYSRPLVGSSNQQFIYLTNRITEKEIMEYKNRYEIRIDKKGNIIFNGMGNMKKMKEYMKKIK